MKVFSKTTAGLVAASMLSMSVAAPAEAQRYRRHHNNGVDAGDVIAGVAIVGGIAAIAAALSKDRSQGRYRDSYQYRGASDDYGTAVSNCGREAEREGRGTVRVTDVNRSGSDRYLVRGVIENGGSDGRGYYDRNEIGSRNARSYDRNGRYDDGIYWDDNEAYGRDGRYDDDGYDGDRYYDRNERDDRYYDGRYGGDQLSFTCVAWGNGRISEFEVNRY